MQKKRRDKMFKNGTLWNDIDGNPIHAHGGWMLSYGGYFYWYGEDRRENYYVSCYRSKDLRNWEFRNHILTTESKMEPYRVRTKLQLISETGGKVNLERPKVLYNKKMEKFVLWVHFENGKDYTDAAIGIAECDTPDGDFVYHGHFNPYGYMSRDCTLFQEEDGTAYFISAARDNADLHVYRLSEDYLNVEKLVHRLWQGEYREAPSVIEPGKIRRSRQYGRRLGHVEKNWRRNYLPEPGSISAELKRTAPLHRRPLECGKLLRIGVCGISTEGGKRGTGDGIL